MIVHIGLMDTLLNSELLDGASKDPLSSPPALDMNELDGASIRTSRRELSEDQKYQLAQLILQLDGEGLQSVITLVNSRSFYHNKCQHEGEKEYVFDLGELDGETLVMLHDLVAKIQPQKQGEHKLALSPSMRSGHNMMSPSAHSCKRKSPSDEIGDTRSSHNDVKKMKKEYAGVEEPVANIFQKEIKQSPPEETKKIRIKIQIYRVERTEAGPKPYKCDGKNCNKTFSDSSNLIKHIRTHTKEKPFVCPIEGCGKSYPYNSSLKEHMNTHTGDKPFVCTFEDCGMSFAQNSNLRRHIRIHTGDRPYGCPECEKAFTQSTNLKQHLITHRKSRYL